MSQPTAALYVRLPQPEADKLDRAAEALATNKKALVTTLVSRYVDPDDPAALAALRPTGEERRRVTVETDDASLTVGRHAFRPAEPAEVLDLAELAELLRLEPDAVRALAEAGELPGRRLGEHWRFSRQAVLGWLGQGSGGTTGS